MNRRVALIAIAVVFAIVCALIAWGQWYAVYVNVPRLIHKAASKPAQRPHAPACVAPPAKTP